jgi:hypothetical protein
MVGPLPIRRPKMGGGVLCREGVDDTQVQFGGGVTPEMLTTHRRADAITHAYAYALGPTVMGDTVNAETHVYRARLNPFRLERLPIGGIAPWVDVTSEAPNLAASLATLPDIREVSFAFDQNRRLALAAQDGGNIHFYQMNPGDAFNFFLVAPGQAPLVEFDEGIRQLSSALPSYMTLQNTDVVLFYTRPDGALVNALQRNAYGTPEIVYAPAAGDVVRAEAAYRTVYSTTYPYVIGWVTWISLQRGPAYYYGAAMKPLEPLAYLGTEVSIATLTGPPLTGLIFDVLISRAVTEASVATLTGPPLTGLIFDTLISRAVTEASVATLTGAPLTGLIFDTLISRAVTEVSVATLTGAPQAGVTVTVLVQHATTEASVATFTGAPVSGVIV